MNLNDILHRRRKCKHGKVKRGRRKGQCLKNKRSRRR